MRSLRTGLGLAILALSVSAAGADYLLVSRSATIKEDHDGDAIVRERVSPGVALVLLEDHQTDGYYHVQAPTVGGDGWIYRTLVRRYSGSPPSTPAPTTPAATGTASSTDLLDIAGTIRVETCEDASTTEECHNRFPAGCSDSNNPQYDAYLNYIKNRLPDPLSAPVRALDRPAIAQLEQSIPSTLTSRNHATHAAALISLGEGEVHSLTGYLYYVTKTGEETCNCGLSGADDVDFHIGVGFDPFPASTNARSLLRQGAALSNSGITTQERQRLQQESVVVEMSPHYRARFQPRWELSRVRQAIGKQVKVIGQLMIDNAHAIPTQDCGMPGSDQVACWRASAWEIHPVTEFYVCTSANPCVPNSSSWVTLGSVP